MLEGSSAAARTALGSERFAGLRARLLQHQDLFLQQIFDLHRCVRRQQQLVAVCDRPGALAEALRSLLALPAEQAANRGSAPTTIADPVRANPKDAQPARSVAAQQAPVPQPLPGPFAPYGRKAAGFGGPGPVFQDALLQPGAAPFDPLAAWYSRHYAAPPPYACAAAAAPILSHPQPAASFHTVRHLRGGTGCGSVCGGYGPAGAIAVSLQTAEGIFPPCSASAGGPVAAAIALDERVAAAPSHGDRWWQDPARCLRTMESC